MFNIDTKVTAGITRRELFKVSGALAAAATSLSAAASIASAAASEKSKKSGQLTVIQYILSRLKELGVEHTFGVPGDFLYDVCDAIQDDPDIKGIWCANELNAGYAADGYARTKGVGVALFTKGAELSPFQSIAGAQAENPKVVHITATASEAEVAAGLALKQDADTAATDAELATHVAVVNPHAVTATTVGLYYVNNTADAQKPISIAAQAALALKQDAATELRLDQARVRLRGAQAGIAQATAALAEATAAIWVNSRAIVGVAGDIEHLLVSLAVRVYPAFYNLYPLQIGTPRQGCATTPLERLHESVSASR